MNDMTIDDFITIIGYNFLLIHCHCCLSAQADRRAFSELASRRRFAHEVLLTQVNSILEGCG